jgi:Protein of unknown function (DUF5132)
MALLDDHGRTLLFGVALGIGAATVARDLFAPLKHLARPTAKAALRSGVVILEQGRLAAARAAEHLEDIVAEIQEERNSLVGERR